MLRGKWIAAALIALPVWSAELKKETVEAWDQYLQVEKTRMVDRAQSHFLWADESQDRLRRVRAGEVVVAPVGHTPEGVPGGLIHHWVGAAFVQGAELDDVIRVVRDYDRYTEFYKPSVVDAKTISRKQEEDRFDVVVLDKAMFKKRAIDSEYESRFTQVEPGKVYSFAATTHVQEIADLTEGNPRKIPESESSGYIWRLSTITRFEERDGGVYIETEALALSRTIPGALHWVVDPIVRRVSRASIATSLEQTRDAASTKRALAFAGQR